MYSFQHIFNRPLFFLTTLLYKRRRAKKDEFSSAKKGKGRRNKKNKGLPHRFFSATGVFYKILRNLNAPPYIFGDA